MKGILYCILGKSGSGKDSLIKELENYGIIPFHECTTRPARPGEINGIDYYFYSEEEFNTADLVCQTSYETAYGLWKFGIMKEEIEEDKMYSLIINPYEYDAVVDYYNDSAKIIFLWIDTEEEQRIAHMILREETKENPDYKEVCRRVISDTKDFNKDSALIQRIRHTADLVYNDFAIPMEEIAEEIVICNSLKKYRQTI